MLGLMGHSAYLAVDTQGSAPGLLKNTPLAWVQFSKCSPLDPKMGSRTHSLTHPEFSGALAMYWVLREVTHKGCPAGPDVAVLTHSLLFTQLSPAAMAAVPELGQWGDRPIT